MSRLSDYSKFDHLDSDDDENDNHIGLNEAESKQGATTAAHQSPIEPSCPSPAVPSLATGTTKKSGAAEGRYVFEYSGQKIYEWEQSLEEVTIYIDAPPHARSSASHFVVNIMPSRLQVGLKGSDRFFIDEKTFDKVKTKESSWFLDDGVITIVLAKCFRGQTWEGVLGGSPSLTSSGGDGGQGIQETVDPFTKQEMQRTLMLERFQEENPGFDFRDATFNGQVPDPRTFMGGVSYNP